MSVGGNCLPEMGEGARMLEQERFAAHRKAAEGAGEDDLLSLRHLPLPLHQVVEQDHGDLAPNSIGTVNALTPN